MIRLNPDLIHNITQTAKESDEGRSVLDAIILLHNGQIIEKTLADQKTNETLEAIDAAIKNISLCIAKKAETIEGFANKFLSQIDESFYREENKGHEDLNLYAKINQIKDSVRESAKSAGLLIHSWKIEWRVAA